MRRTRLSICGAEREMSRQARVPAPVPIHGGERSCRMPKFALLTIDRPARLGRVARTGIALIASAHGAPSPAREATRK